MVFTKYSPIFIIVFGLLGATVSGLLSNSQERKSLSIDEYPEALDGFWASFAKLVFGATSALVIFVFLRAGLLPIVEPNELTPEFVLVVSFISGFSDRLLLKAMEDVAIQEST